MALYLSIAIKPIATNKKLDNKVALEKSTVLIAVQYCIRPVFCYTLYLAKKRTLRTDEFLKILKAENS
jgi:hypothetical protein